MLYYGGGAGWGLGLSKAIFKYFYIRFVCKQLWSARIYIYLYTSLIYVSTVRNGFDFQKSHTK